MKNNLNIELVMVLTGSGKTEYIKSKVNKQKANLICYKNLKANYSKNFNFIDLNEDFEDKILSFQNQIIVIDDFEELENKNYLINILNSLYENKKEIFIKNKWYISLKSHEILNKISWLSKYLVLNKPTWLKKNNSKILNNQFIGKTKSGENQKFNLVDIKKEHYILDTFSIKNEKTECGVAFCRNISSYVRVNFTIKTILKNNLELYIALVLCNNHYNNLK